MSEVKLTVEEERRLNIDLHEFFVTSPSTERMKQEITRLCFRNAVLNKECAQLKDSLTAANLLIAEAADEATRLQDRIDELEGGA